MDDTSIQYRIRLAQINGIKLNEAFSSKEHRRAAASDPNATADHLHKALDDEDPEVRIAAARNPKVNAEHLHKALNDRDVEVRRAVAGNVKALKKSLWKVKQ